MRQVERVAQPLVAVGPRVDLDPDGDAAGLEQRLRLAGTEREGELVGRSGRDGAVGRARLADGEPDHAGADLGAELLVVVPQREGGARAGPEGDGEGGRADEGASR
nr:hypothetical protein DA06_08365 [Georgenia sp. SUBG003]